MMLSDSQLEYVAGDGDDDGDENWSNRKLLLDIEEISKALYVHKPPQADRDSAHVIGPRLVKKPILTGSDVNIKSRVIDESFSIKEQNSLSLWNWKPLRALSHIRHHKFNVCFFLNVHSIEGLPPAFNGYSLSVIWERKDEFVKTCPSNVLNGVAEFDETLMHKCRVYGSRVGPQRLAKYDMKLSSIYPSRVGNTGADMGKQWVDLTRLLPLTFEELEGKKSTGKWATVLKLSGKAKGAVLNISFGFSVVKDNFFDQRSDMKRLMNRTLYAMERETRGNRMLQRVGSVPSDLDCRPSNSSLSLKEKSQLLGLELSRSINLLYEKLNKEPLSNDNVQQIKSKPILKLESVDCSSGDESDNPEFNVIDCGIETSENGELGLNKGNPEGTDGLAIEVINFCEIVGEEDLNLEDDLQHPSEDNIVFSNCGKALVDDSEKEDNDNDCTTESGKKTPPLIKKSSSFDKITESTANDFLKMLGIERCPPALSSDSIPESPRERLLREFEKEALASFNFLLDYDEEGPNEDSSFSSSMSGSICTSKDSCFSFTRPVFEENHQEESHLLSRRKAKDLEIFETEALMGEWGLSEKDFLHSADYNSNGFGSPVELLPESSKSITNTWSTRTSYPDSKQMME